MHNGHRGEISARLDGRTYRLCLTLGALAELETAFGAEDLVALAGRFESGRLRAADAIRILAAGLRGAGTEVSDEAVAAMRCDDGAGGYMAIVVRLLAATFGGDEDSEPDGATDPPGGAAEAGARVPFPGTT